MKKAIRLTSIILAALMLLSVFTLAPITASAETSGDFEYTVLDNGTAQITKYKGSASELVIPSTLDDYNVKSIGEDAFYWCTSLTSVTIPDSVTSIDVSAFDHCYSLTSITIPNSVTSIGEDAFYRCESLTSVTIGNSVTSIGDSAFADCTSLTSINVTAGNKFYCSVDGNLYSKDRTTLIQYSIGKKDTSFTIPNSVTSIGSSAVYRCESITSVIIPDSVMSIGDYVFYGCTSLTSVTIPDSVTSIGGYAFWGCTSLTSVTIPDSVTSIGNHAFYYCTSLTSITIPDGVTSIGNYAFYRCASLTSINVNPKNKNYCSVDGNLYNKNKTIIIQYIIGKKDTSFTIPDSVTSIGVGTFGYCKSLASVTIPDSVTGIGDLAFYDCTSLTSVTIPDSVTSIGDDALGYYFRAPYGAYDSSDFTIYGTRGSAAEKYANDKGFLFVNVGETEPSKINISNWKVKSLSEKIPYQGWNVTQDVYVVSDSGEVADIGVTYKNNKNVGTATVIINGIGKYTGTITTTFRIVKAKNPITAKANSKSASLKTLKKKAVTVKKAITVKKNQGAVTYKKVSGAKQLTISKSGVITVRKGTKKGNYSIKVKVTAKGNGNYKSGSKTVTVKIKVK